MMKVVVTGATGLVGYRLMQLLSGKEEVIGFYHREKPLNQAGSWYPVNLQSREEVRNTLDTLHPSVIIHCAASCQPVHCEQHPQETLSINYGGTIYLAEWAAAHHCFLVHVSTDLVFDGRQGDYREEDHVHPISIYGWSKLAAEEAVRTRGGNWCIVRTALIYGRSPGGNRSADEILVHSWKQGRPTPLFVDEYRTPTATGELAEKLIEVAQQKITGLLHIAGRECLSRFEFGGKIAKLLGFPLQLLLPRKIEEVVSVPPRAPNVSMNISKARTLLATPFRSVEENLRQEYGLSEPLSSSTTDQ